MKKCEVLAERISLVVGKGSIVLVNDTQFELAKKFLKPVEEEVKTVKKTTKKK